MLDDLKIANTEVLEQLHSFLDGLPDAYYGPSRQDDSGTIGRHVRHILDLYRALMDRVVSGIIDYDKRNRDSSLERDKQEAVSETQRMLDWVCKLDTCADSPVVLKTEVSVYQARTVTLETTLSRELCYVASHTTHHLASMVLLAQARGLAVDDTLGVAPATATYRRTLLKKLS